MHSGTLINELIALVERAQTFAKPPQINLAECKSPAVIRGPRFFIASGKAQSPKNSRSRLV